MSAHATAFSDFTHEVQRAVDESQDEQTLTEAVATLLTDLLASGYLPPQELRRPHPDHYVMYPLHVADDGSFSVASAVWNVGQGTPVHGHETWGVVGIAEGVERELRYVKPLAPDVPLVSLDEHSWQPGEVTVCCTLDDDVHTVSCEGEVPCVGIHVYGANIGILDRRRYDPATGEVNWFVSRWTDAGSIDV